MPRVDIRQIKGLRALGMADIMFQVRSTPSTQRAQHMAQHALHPTPAFQPRHVLQHSRAARACACRALPWT